MNDFELSNYGLALLTMFSVGWTLMLYGGIGLAGGFRD